MILLKDLLKFIKGKMKDKKINKLIELEKERLNSNYNLIASENIPNNDILEALGSCLSIKYSEGEVNKRYYQGNKYIDAVETECKDRLLKLFDCKNTYVANVVVSSGSQANLAILLTFLNPGDKILSLDTNSGSHITHGFSNNFSGKLFKIINFNLDKNNILDYKEIERIALKENPKLIICGFTTYSRKFSFKKFSEIAKKSKSLLLCDIGHICGLVVTKFHPSPIGWADFITSTTQKTLRGPRSAFVLVKKEYENKLNKGIFPGLIGGPKNNEIAAKAIGFKEAMQPSFKNYIRKVLENTKYLCEELKKREFDIVSNGTDNHMFCIDLKNKGMDGKTFAEKLERKGVIVNANMIPGDMGTPRRPDGVRIGLALETTKGITKKQINEIISIMEGIK